MPLPIDFTLTSVVAPVCNQSDLDFLNASEAATHCDVIELRLDNLLNSLDQTASFLSEQAPALPVLATVRHPDEGGTHSLSSAKRQDLYLRFIPQVDAIDLELRSASELSQVIETARTQQKAVILSFHDFKNTPSLPLIQSKIDQAIDAGADVCKIAIHLNSLPTLCELAQLCQSESRINISLMGMGPLGKISRLLFAKAGSVLNYGYLKEANAPGQWPAKQLKDLITEI